MFLAGYNLSKKAQITNIILCLAEEIEKLRNKKISKKSKNFVSKG